MLKDLSMKDYEYSEPFKLKYGAQYNNHQASSESNDVETVFTFLGQNTEVEWKGEEYKDGSKTIGTTHTKHGVSIDSKGKTAVKKMHSHGGMDESTSSQAEQQDMDNALDNGQNYLLSRRTNYIVKYSKENPCISRREIKNDEENYNF